MLVTPNFETYIPMLSHVEIRGEGKIAFDYDWLWSKS